MRSEPGRFAVQKSGDDGPIAQQTSGIISSFTKEEACLVIRKRDAEELAIEKFLEGHLSYEEFLWVIDAPERP
jgi:phage-related protein